MQDSQSKYRELIYYSELILHLVKRDFSLQFKRSFLGMLWSLLMPLSQLAVLSFVFGKLIPLNIEAYPAFIFCGILPWFWFSNCLSTSGDIFLSNRDLLKKPNFHPYLLPIINTLSNLVLYLVAIPVLLLILLAFDRTLTANILFLPIIMFVQALLIVGLSLIIATLNITYSDIKQIVIVALMLLFYLSPVFYGTDIINSNYRVFYMLNPIAVLITNYRNILFYGTGLQWVPFVYSIVFSIITFYLGFFIYKKRLNRIFDEL